MLIRLVPLLLIFNLVACNDEPNRPTEGADKTSKSSSEKERKAKANTKNTPATRPAANPPKASLRMTNVDTKAAAIELAEYLNIHKSDMTLNPSLNKEIILGSKINRGMNFTETIDYSLRENQNLSRAFGATFTFYPVQSQDGADLILILGNIDKPGIPFNYRKDLLLNKMYLCNEFTFFKDDFKEGEIKNNFFFNTMFNKGGTSGFPGIKIEEVKGKEALKMRMDNIHNAEDLRYLTDQVVDLKPEPIVTFDWLGSERFALMDGEILPVSEVYEYYKGEDYMKLQIACIFELRSGTGWY